jgi:hypothetical protein
MPGRVYSRREIADLASFDGNRRRTTPDWGNRLANSRSEMKRARRAIDVKLEIPPVHIHPAFDWDEACRIIACIIWVFPDAQPTAQIHNQPHPTPGELHGRAEDQPLRAAKLGSTIVTPHGVGDPTLSSGLKSGRARGNRPEKPGFHLRSRCRPGRSQGPISQTASRPNFAMASHAVAGTESTSTTRALD